MTEEEETEEEETESSENEGIDEENRERIHVTLVMIGGVVSALISNFTFGFADYISILPAVAIAVVVLGIFAAAFETPSKKKVLFTFIITIVTWFMAGTFILQLL